MRISIELVPRNPDSLIAELNLIKNHFITVNTINIPDIMRLNMRSWEGCGYAKQCYQDTIPHIRAMDINSKESLPMETFLQQNDITEVLIVSGDSPQDMNRKVFPSTCIDIIRKFKTELPDIKVYAALDPYRNSIRQEMEYIQRKMDAGADGFFTQPFFDIRLMEIYAELLNGIEIFWGVCPVASEKSHNYWKTKNNAVFPLNFKPSLAWNVKFAKKALDFARERNNNIYFMPIRTDLLGYLNGILS